MDDNAGREYVKTEITQFDFENLQFHCMDIPNENTVMVENREQEVLATKPIITTNVNMGKVLE